MAFLQGSQPSHQPFLVAPASVLWLIGVIIGLHVLRVVLPGDWPEILLDQYAFIPARYAGGADFAGESAFQKVVPFFSHIFLHANFTHVGLNSVWLLAFGPLVARRLGVIKFLLFFVVCGVAGAFVQLVVYWGQDAAVVGASGAISGLMGAAMRMVYGNLYRRPLAPLFSRQILVFSAVWMTVNIVTGVLGLGVSDEFVLVAWVVHLGGYFGGLLAIGFFDWLPLGERGWRQA